MKKWLIAAIVLLIVSSFLFLVLNQKFNSQKESANISITPINSSTPTSSPSPTISSSPTIAPKITKASVSNTQTTLDELFVKYGNTYGVDPVVLKNIASCESGFDPNQITGDYAGLFQFGSIAWQEARGRLGENPDLSLRFNAEESIKTAAHEIQIKGTSGWDDCD